MRLVTEREGRRGLPGLWCSHSPPPASLTKFQQFFQQSNFSAALKKYSTFCFGRQSKITTSSQKPCAPPTHVTSYSELWPHWSDSVTERSDWLRMTADCDEQNWSRLETIVATKAEFHAHLCEPWWCYDQSALSRERNIIQQKIKQHLDHNVGSREPGSAQNWHHEGTNRGSGDGNILLHFTF